MYKRQKPYETELKQITKLANMGDAKSQYLLGYHYANGYGIKNDNSKALKWYRKSAEQGFAPAQNKLGDYYFCGIKVKKDYKKAIEYYKEAAKNGNVSAIRQIGEYFYYGIMTKIDYELATKYYKMSAEKGDKGALQNLANCYMKGKGVEQSFRKAEEFYRKAYEKGNQYCYYYVKIFDQLRGRKIAVVNDISEEIKDENIGAVLIMPRENDEEYIHILYDIETYNAIKTRINEILNGIEEVDPSKKNEFEIFMKIYIKLGKVLSYDNEALKEIKNGIDQYKPAQAMAGVLENKCVCSRICRNIKKCTSM